MLVKCQFDEFLCEIFFHFPLNFSYILHSVFSLFSYLSTFITCVFYYFFSPLLKLIPYPFCFHILDTFTNWPMLTLWILLTYWRLVPRIHGLGSMGNAYYLKIKSSLRSCCGSVDKTTDSQSWDPRFESAGSGSSALGQGTLSSLPSPSERT